LAAPTLRCCRREEAATHLRETADCWNDNIERWCYAKDSDSRSRYRVEDITFASRRRKTDAQPLLWTFMFDQNLLRGKALSRDPRHQPDVWHWWLPTAAPDDPRILNTIKVIDLCWREITAGPCGTVQR